MFLTQFLTSTNKFYLLCLNVTGFWPFDFDIRLRRFKFNVFYLIGPFVIVPYILVIYILSANIVMSSVAALFKNVGLKMVSNVYLSSSVLNVIFIYFSQICHWKKLQRLVYRTMNLHVNLCGCLSWNDMYYHPYLIRFTIKSLVFSVTLVAYVIVSMTMIAPDAMKYYTIPGFLIPFFINKFYPDIHYGGMLLAELYFHRINEELRRILLNPTKYDDAKSVDIADQLDTLAINYVELMEIVNDFNKIVSFHVVLWILLGLFNLILHLFMEYIFVCIPIRYGHSLNIIIFASGVIVLLYQFLDFGFISSVCASVLRKVNETETILSAVYVHLQNDGPFVKSVNFHEFLSKFETILSEGLFLLYYQVDLFFNRIKHQNFQISGCGLFSLDLTFLYSVKSTTLT